MINNRPFLLISISACLLWSTAIFSKNDATAEDFAVIDPALTDDHAPIQLAMLTESHNDQHSAKVVPTNLSKAPDVHTDDDSAQTSDAIKLDEYFSDEQIATLRQLFLQAEDALSRRDEKSYFQLAEQLKEYPLYPYLRYQWLKKHLNQGQQVKTFLQEHESSRYARILKRKWLNHLAKKNQWQTFLEFYTETSDTSLNCYYHRAQYKTGDKQAALEGAKELWAVGKSQPKACDPLFAQLKKSSLYNQDLFWQRFDAALQNNKTSLAKYVKKLMSPADQKTADLWLKLHRDPERYITKLLNRPVTAQSPLMFTHAINRLTSKDINQAIALLG